MSSPDDVKARQRTRTRRRSQRNNLTVQIEQHKRSIRNKKRLERKATQHQRETKRQKDREARAQLRPDKPDPMERMKQILGQGGKMKINIKDKTEELGDNGEVQEGT